MSKTIQYDFTFYCMRLTGDQKMINSFDAGDRVLIKKKIRTKLGTKFPPIYIAFDYFDPVQTWLCFKPRTKAGYKKFIAQLDLLTSIKITYKKVKFNPAIKRLKPEFKLAPKSRPGYSWDTLEHNGPNFAWLSKPYVRHNRTLLYNGQKVTLTSEAEQFANHYAAYLNSLLEGKDKWTTNKLATFSKEYIKLLHKTPQNKKFKVWSKFEFKTIQHHIAKVKKEKKSATKEEKKRMSKTQLDLLKNKKTEKIETNLETAFIYSFIRRNGVREKIKNPNIEILSIFRGRDKKHKTSGKLRFNTNPKAITVIGTLLKNRFGIVKFVNNHKARYTATWTDAVTGNKKYVLFGDSSDISIAKSIEKFEKARKLHIHFAQVEREYNSKLMSKNQIDQQYGVITWLLATLGIRIGGDKDDQSVLTFGITTLQVRHIKFLSNNTVIISFSGKDSIMYTNKHVFPCIIYKLLADFSFGKSSTENVFDLCPAQVNQYLKTIDKDLTAKVFRTRLANSILYPLLQKRVKSTLEYKLRLAKFEAANLHVGKILNHRKTRSTTQKASDKKKAEKIKLQIIKINQELKSKLTPEKKQKLSTKLALIKSKRSIRASGMEITATTSRNNYIDPRMVASWCDKNDVKMSSIYTGASISKYKWYQDNITKTWNYERTPLDNKYANMQGIVGAIVKCKPRRRLKVPKKAFKILDPESESDSDDEMIASVNKISEPESESDSDDMYIRINKHVKEKKSKERKKKIVTQDDLAYMINHGPPGGPAISIKYAPIGTILTPEMRTFNTLIRDFNYKVDQDGVIVKNPTFRINLDKILHNKLIINYRNMHKIGQGVKVKQLILKLCQDKSLRPQQYTSLFKHPSWNATN